MICFHKWGKWSESFQAYRGDNHQARNCEKCGKTAIRCVVGVGRAYVQPRQINDALKGVAK